MRSRKLWQHRLRPLRYCLRTILRPSVSPVLSFPISFSTIRGKWRVGFETAISTSFWRTISRRGELSMCAGCRKTSGKRLPIWKTLLRICSPRNGVNSACAEIGSVPLCRTLRAGKHEHNFQTMELVVEKRDVLTKQLRSPDEETRRLAVVGLAAYPLADVKENLFTAMGDASWRVRKEAVDAVLAGVLDDTTMETIVGMLA